MPVVGSLAGALSGWLSIARRFPDNQDVAVARFDFGKVQVGAIGLPWPTNLSACPTGLRVRTNRFFFPFGRSFLVPWSEIHVQLKKAGSWDFYDTARLTFGQPCAGRMVIPADTWAALAKSAGREPAGN